MVDSRGAVDLSERLIAENATLREQITVQDARFMTLREGFEKVNDMLRREDRGWGADLINGDDDNGMSLDDLKRWSKKIRAAVVGAPWIKRGLSLRSSYIWQGGIHHGNIPNEGRGKGTNVQALVDHPANQRNFYGKGAKKRCEGRLYHDGLAVWFGDDRTKMIDSIPLDEIVDQLRDPDHKSTIWAYKRKWVHTDLKTGATEERAEWVFVDGYTDKRVNKITRNGVEEKVNPHLTAFDMHANSMDGFAYGSPDALAGFIWSQIARDAYMDGTTMTSAMATFAFKASVTTKTGADNASMKLAMPGHAGQTSVLGATNDLVPMSSAGKAYDFGALRGLTAIIAASLDVSNIALTADPGAAGSSYGSASTLDLPTRLAMEARRLEHIEVELRVLHWMGAKNAVAYFKTLEDPTDIYREVQALLLLWSSGLYRPEPLEKRLSELMEVIGNSVPDGVLVPNNEKSLARKDIDTDGVGGVGNPNATPAGQGQNSPVGKAPKDDSLRNDQIANMLTLLDRFATLEERVHAGRDGVVD